MKKIFISLTLLFASCGSEQESSLDIVGGSPTYQSWYGRLEVARSFRCGSSLIAKRYAITAKHCIPSEDMRGRIKLKFGSYDSSDKENGGKPFDLVKVQKVFLHPKYDLAILKLERPARFSPVRFSVGDVPDGAFVRAIGHGAVGWKKPTSDKLLTVKLIHVKDAGIYNRKDHLIYAGRSVGKDICHGDSGGPLIHNGALVGVAFWTGSQCGNYDSYKRPSAFTRPDIRWINSIIDH